MTALSYFFNGARPAVPSMNTGKLLIPLGAIYGRAMCLRNALYDRGILRSHSLGARTISIGNLTTGGTGKTPLVEWAARLLAENGEKVCVLTRGYGRANEAERVLVSDGEAVLVGAATGGDAASDMTMPVSISAPQAASDSRSTVHHHSPKGVRSVRETMRSTLHYS